MPSPTKIVEIGSKLFKSQIPSMSTSLPSTDLLPKTSVNLPYTLRKCRGNLFLARICPSTENRINRVNITPNPHTPSIKFFNHKYNIKSISGLFPTAHLGQSVRYFYKINCKYNFGQSITWCQQWVNYPSNHVQMIFVILLESMILGVPVKF